MVGCCPPYAGVVNCFDIFTKMIPDFIRDIWPHFLPTSRDDMHRPPSSLTWCLVTPVFVQAIVLSSF